MSSTIPILSALLLSLILGSTEGGQRMESVSLLRQTLRYWRKIYKTYSDEVTLGYCWANHLLKMSNDWSTNLFALPSAVMEDRSDTTVNATLIKKMHPREKRWSHRTARSTISRFPNDLHEHRVASRSKMVEKRRKIVTNKTEQASRTVPNNYTGRHSEIDENERIARMIDYQMKRRRRALSIVPELLRDERQIPRDGHEFSSRGTSSHAVNPTPNPREDDKVDSGSTDPGKEDSRRKVLRSLTSRDSFVENAFASRSFSLKVARGGSLGDQRFPFRRYSPSRERNSRVDEMLPDPWMSQEDRGIERDLARHRASLNNDGSPPTSSRSQFRRVNADAQRVSVVKLMDSEGNSSYDPTINLKTPRGKLEELSRDLLLSPRAGSAITERSLFEFRGSEEEALKRNVLAIQNGQRKRHEEATLSTGGGRGELKGRKGRFGDNDTSVLFVGAQKIAPTYALQKSRVFRRPGNSTEIETGQQPHSRGARSAPSLLNIKGFNRNYEDLASQSAQPSKIIVEEEWDFDLKMKPISFNIYSLVTSIFGALGRFVSIGRQIINVIQTNAALACTKEYLWAKIIRWIDE